LQSDLENLEIDTLLFCLEAGLRSLPLAALHDGSQFLVENYSLSLVPSFSLLDRTYSAIDKERVLAMGASEFRDLPPLPAVPLELQLVTGAIDSKPDGEFLEGESFLNTQFTEANLKTQRQTVPYDIVHLATHADFQSGDLSNSYIQFWDKSLGLNELPQLNLSNPRVNLLVLSACQTALGDREAELGFGGLAIYSGARSAMASLWSVSDAGTLLLMGSVYHHLGTAPIKAEALQLAQRDLISGAARWDGEELHLGDRTIPLPPELKGMGAIDLSHPYYWSGFTTIGSPW
jgi:CHAT domain-containing protein